ncbi:Golgi transport complex subunit 5-domain-containing protein [Phlyctochytrium arcticum]|nr:Golgi transport complex subunit 5-domain-containing protein [Phlyctochytrium arcticum]
MLSHRPSVQAGTIQSTTVDSLLANADYREFTTEDFDASQYANRVIQAPADSPFRGMDIATSLAKLSFAVEHLNKHIQEQVTNHYEDLLEQVTGLSQMEDVLATVKTGLGSLNDSFDRVREKVLVPYQQMRDHSVQLERVQQAAEVLRRIIRFMYLLRRLDTQLPGGERELPKAALTISELDSIVQDESLLEINIIRDEAELVKNAKKRVIAEGEQILQRGTSMQTADIAAGLQIFYNLGQLSPKVKDMVDRMLLNVQKETQSALDAGTLNKEVKGNQATSPRRDGAPQPPSSGATDGLWARLERLMDVIYENASKVYQLERVLSRRRDPLTHTLFLDEVNKGLNDTLLSYFWKSLSASFDRELRVATKSSQYLLHLFQSGYPRLLRLVHNVFARISVITGIDYSDETQRPESLWILRTLAPFETAYLSRSMSRLMELINAAFPDRPGPTQRPLPSRDDVDRIVRSLNSEMEIAKFDAHLLKAVSKNGQKAIKMFSAKCEQLVTVDSNTQLCGTGPASQNQVLIIESINTFWWMQESLWHLLDEFSEATTDDSLHESAQDVTRALANIVQQVFRQITRELESVLKKIHREDYNARVDSRAPQDSSTSPYVVEFASRIRWLHRELLSRLQCGEESREWIRNLGQRVVDFFLRHASLIRPSNEGIGRVLAGDMTQLEFVLSQWYTATGMKLERDLGESYKALRGFRHLPFLALDQVVNLYKTQKLPAIIVLHHLFARAHPQIPSPMILYGWSETQYSDWIDAHSEADVLVLLDRCLESYADESRRREETGLCAEYMPAKEIIAEKGIETKV